MNLKQIVVNGQKLDVSGGSGGVVNWENVNGRPDLSNVSSMTVAPIVLNRLLWTDNQQTMSIEGILEDEKAQLIIPIPTSASEDLYKTCGIKAVSQSENTLVFEAATTPTEDVNVIVYIIGAAEVGEVMVAEWWSPQMTSQNTPQPFEVTPGNNGNNNQSNGGYIWQLFAGDNAYGMYIRRMSDGPYVQIDLGKAYQVIGISLIRSEDYAIFLPQSFDLQGSNDNITWTTITSISPSLIDGTQEFTFKNGVAYRYYRLTNFVDYNGDSNPNGNGAIIFNNLKFFSNI